MVAGIGFYNQPAQQNQMNVRRKGSVLQGLQDKYGCEECFENRPYFSSYPIAVQELPKRAIRPSWFTRILNVFFGG